MSLADFGLRTPMEVCATDVLPAPAERIWHLLTDPRKLAEWTGTKLLEGPAWPMSAGDHVVLRAGGLRITLDVLDMHPPRQIQLHVWLPFGITNREQIQITPIDAHSSRVTLNSHFIFLPDWRGQLVEKILRRRIVTAPARSLRRLKRAAAQDPILA
jgi:uncharacterized protein YndB with AHSA1/START domain